MKRIMDCLCVFVGTLLLASCAGLSSVSDELSVKLQPFVGKDVQKLIDVIGLPTNQINLNENSSVIVWQNKRNGLVSRMTPFFVTDWDYKHTRLVDANMRYETVFYCDIKSAVKESIITKIEVNGDNEGCANYLSRLK